MKVKVYVTLKKGVLDPPGQAVQRTLARTGFDEVADVRIGKYIELEVPEDTTAARVEEMCRYLLANTVIEDFRVEGAAPAPVAESREDATLERGAAATREGAQQRPSEAGAPPLGERGER